MLTRRCSGLLEAGLLGMMLVVAGCQDSITVGELVEIPRVIEDADDGTAQANTGSLSSDYGTLNPSMRIAVCSADVRRPGREGPMLPRRTTLQFGDEAIAAADGQTTTATYRLFDFDGRLIQEVRCTIPRSWAALESFKGRFMLPAPRDVIPSAGLIDDAVVAFTPEPPDDPPLLDPILVQACTLEPWLPGCQDVCDPWWDLSWCQCEEETMVIGSSADDTGSATVAYSADCGHGGGGGGGDGGDGGDGGGGGGGGGSGDFDSGWTNPPPYEIYPDTLPVPVPPCPLTGANVSWEAAKSWCNGTPVSGLQKTRVQKAITDMAEIDEDGPCSELAAHAQILLDSGNVRVFDRTQANTGGAGFAGGITILNTWIDNYHTTPFREGEYETNLQMIVAHEAEHSLRGPGHVYVGGTGGWYQQTTNSFNCSGLGESPQ